MAGRRNRNKRSRGSSVPIGRNSDVMYGTLTLGSTTSWQRKSFPVLAGMGDRPFQITAVRYDVVSQGPMMFQVRLYNPDGNDNVASSGVQLAGTTPRSRWLRPVRGQNVWFNGNTPQTTVLVAIDGLAAVKGAKTPDNIVTLEVQYRLAPNELQSASVSEASDSLH